MKKFLSIFMMVVLCMFLVGCVQTSDNQDVSSDTSTSAQTEAEGTQDSTAADTEAESTEPNGDSNVLVAYFSQSGNTEEMAAHIAEQTGGEILEIRPETPYPTDYNECGDVALEERDSNARPAIADLPESMDGYDTILIGYPIWWHTAPMIIGTFLENYDLTGVDIYPFTQSASMDTEQFDNSIDFVRENTQQANVHDGLFARPSDTDAIDDYLTENGLIK